MKVSEMMSKEIACCDSNASLADCAAVMWQYDCGFVPVVEPGTRKLVGVLTDRDACIGSYIQGRGLCDIAASSAMTKSVVSIGPDEDVAQAEELMHRHQLHRLPVVNAAGNVVGVLSLNEVVCRAAAARGSAADVMPRGPAETCAGIVRSRARAANA